MQKVDIRSLMQNENKWVALSSDQKHIIESGNSVEELEKKLRRKKVKGVVISFIPPADKSLSPNDSIV